MRTPVTPANALQELTFARRVLEAAGAHDPQSWPHWRPGRRRPPCSRPSWRRTWRPTPPVSTPTRCGSATAQERMAALTTLVRRHAADDIDGVLAWAAQASRATARARRHRRQRRSADRAGCRARRGAGPGWPRSCPPRGRLRRSGSARRSRRSWWSSRCRTPSSPQSVSQRESADGLRGRATAGSLPGPEGVDDVELLLVPHPGAPARPLHKGASGGELSRVMLAVEVVFAGSDPLPAHGLRRGRRRRRWQGGRRGGPSTGPPRHGPPGRRRHPPAAGRRVRRHAPGGGEGHGEARAP